jgi:dipeptidase D
MTISELKPHRIWKHFQAINAIPRASTKEDRISKYMVSFGKSLNLETSIDSIGNVIIKKPGTHGKEHDKTVVLQGHLDMVHQKTANSNFNFEKQGIDMYVDGDWVKAKETTLGADNGLGVATIMGVLVSNDIEHPPIEALFTIDEEVGMTGAMALTRDQLKGEVLLNLDSEEDDMITIGCAGGVDVEIDAFFDLETLHDDYKYYEITVDGLNGGHSGVEIHLNLGNAIRIFTKYLDDLNKEIDVCISMIKCGELTNVIPRFCLGTIAIKKTDVKKFDALSASLINSLKQEYTATDKSLSIVAKPLKGSFFVASHAFSSQLLTAIQSMPNGIFSMTEGMDDLVQTSNNIAKIAMIDGVLKIACHTRSSVDKERSALVNIIKETFSFAHVKEVGPYPGWEPKPTSDILKIAKTCYLDLYKKEPLVKSIHAGLECGVLSGIYPEMEMISIGPNIFGAHSPDERAQISSTQKFWMFLVEILKKI